MAAFETEQLVVRDLFSDDYVFKFPLYQRPYRWGTEHAEALLNDILEAATGPGKVDDMPAYFVGSIVLVKQADDRTHLVIDGRQRLTTIGLLLAVLRDLERKSNLRADLHEMLFDQQNEISNIQSGPRLDPGGIDGEGLRKWVIEDGATARNVTDEAEEVPERVQRVVEVVGVFRQRVMGLDDAQRTRLRDFLIRRCEMVAVITADENQGLRIFQVLNTRGLPLSDVDLIKPDLLTPLPSEVQQEALACWDEAETALGAEGMSRLLRAIYVIQARRMPFEDPKKFHEDFLRLTTTRDLAKLTTEDIPNYADVLAQIEHGTIPSAGDDRDPNTLLRGLTWLRWTSEDYLPVAMEMLVRAGDDTDKAFRWLQGLDRVCYSFFILKPTERSSRDDRREVFLKALDDLSLNRDPMREGGPLYLIPEDRRRIMDMLQRPIETPYQRRALLQRIEVAMSPKVHPKIDDATCEHVLPFKTWKTSWDKYFDPRTHRESVNLLGNLVLLNKRHNDLAGNKPFIEKKRVLFRASRQRFFETAKSLRSYDEWTPDIIRKRTQELATTLAATWEL